MTLPKYAELGTAHRGDPCQEYAGTYHIYHNGKELAFFSADVGETEALAELKRMADQDPRSGKFSLAWSATDDDPRIGQVWFTGYYTITQVEV